MKQLHLLVPLMAGVLLAGCSDPTDGLPDAQVQAAPATASSSSATAPPANAKPFMFGAESGTIEFVGSKVTGSHQGGFKNFMGEFSVADGKLAKTGHKIVIDANSLWSDNNRLTGHLKNADFFDVPTYPTATFVATSLDQNGSAATVTGLLTLHGITKEISFPAQVSVSDQAVEMTAEFALNRFDFEMKYAGKADDLIRKDVALKIKVKATPGKADFSKIQPPPPAA